MSRIDWPTASLAVYPNIRSAPPFHEAMMPLRSLLRMASSDDSTIAASCCAIRVDASSASMRRVSLVLRRQLRADVRDTAKATWVAMRLASCSSSADRWRGSGKYSMNFPMTPLGVLERDEGHRGDPFGEDI